MQKSREKVTAIIALFLLIASGTILIMQVQPVEAQLEGQTSGQLPAGITANYTVKVTPYLSFRPNPVGVDQTFLVNMWTSPAPGVNRLWMDFKVTITKPDGTKDIITMDSYLHDGTSWFEYVADQVGEWKLKFEFPGNYFPTLGLYATPSSTAEQKLVVQEAWIASWPESPLPTDYWTRPVAYEHREWWPILGDWPWYGPGQGAIWDQLYPDTNRRWSANYRFTPWVQGPTSAHIAWKRPHIIGGIIGGDFTTMPMTTAGVLTIGVTAGGNPNIVFQGRAYQTLTKPMPTIVNDTVRTLPVSVWRCYDLRTGEVYWELTDVTAPTYIEYTVGVHAAGAEHVTATNLIAISGSRLLKYSPVTGAVTLNISIPVTGTYYMNGYCLAVQNLGNSVPENQRYRLINWTTFGTSSNFTSRIISNTTYARSSLPTLIDWNAGYGATASTLSTQGIYSAMTVLGFNLLTGQQLWNQTLPGLTQYSGSANVADHGKVAILTEQGYYIAFDMYSGNKVWESDRFAYPWSEPGFGAYAVQSAYGMFYRQAYDGVYAFNWDDGSLAWKYTAPAFAQYETPYVDENGTTVYSWNVCGYIAEGKMYVYNNEHTPSTPITRGWGLHCINATNGEGIWDIMITGAAGAREGDIGPVVDGYLSLLGSDGYQYVFGKGKSKTTVTASPKTVTKGETVLIEGTILDQSPAQPNTPCVSRESMALQMEYLHKQMPIAGIWGNETIEGVPLTLTAIASDGTVTEIGATTTNGYYGTFNKAWKPPAEGTYEIIASFEGDNSYSSSAAATGLSVDPAPNEPETPTQPQIVIPDYTLAIVGTGIAVIIAVAIAVLILRKR
jgi:hypothetical protein